MSPEPAPPLLDPSRLCPLCGGETDTRLCKVYCTRCRAIVQNCSGD